jgi:CHAT domain-containing protein
MKPKNIQNNWKFPKTLINQRNFLQSLLLLILFLMALAIPPVVAQMSPQTPRVQIQADGSSLEKQARSLYQTRNFPEAAIFWEQAVAAFAKQGDQLNHAMALSNLSLTRQQLREWELAQKAIDESLNILQTLEKTPETQRILAQTLDIQGKQLREVEKPEKALETWQQAADLYREIDRPEAAAQNEFNQIQVLQDLGLYPRACKSLLSMLELNVQNCQALRELTPEDLKQQLQVFAQPPASLLEVQKLRNLGDVLRVLGQPTNSEVLLEASLKAAKQLEAFPNKNAEIAAIYLSLGNTARVQGKNDALTCYQKAVDAATEPGTATLKIQAQLNQLSLLVKKQSWSKVSDLVSQIEPQLNNLPPSRAAINARLNFAQSLFCWKEPTLSEEERQLSSPIIEQCSLARGREKNNQLQPTDVPKWEDIAEIVTTAVKQSQTLGNKRAEAYALGYQGSVEQQMENCSEAQDLTIKALNISLSFQLPDIAYLWQWQLGRLREIQGEEDDAIAAYNTAFATLQSLRGDLVSIDQEVQFTFRDSVEPVYREYVDLLLRGEDISQDNLKQAREVIEALKLAELDDFFRNACLEAKPQQIDKVIKETSSPTAFFYAIILKDRLEVILALSGGKELQHYHTNKSQDEVKTIKETIKKLRTYLSNRTRTGDVKKESQKVYNWLIKKAQKQLETNQVQTLVFVLDGQLRNIPMAVLYNIETERYLVEDYAIALTPGLQLLDPQPIKQVSLNVLTGGVSERRKKEEIKNFGRTKRIDFPEIQFVKDELTDIGLVIPNSPEPLLNKEFLKEQLQKELKSAKFNAVHLATHGNFSSNPEETYILTWDRLLKIQDLENFFQIKRANQSNPIELLVLSACKTAKGDERATLGIAGIAVRAGARSTLATLWPAFDESTAEFMLLFYQQLIQNNAENMTKAEALRQAQLKFLDDKTEKRWNRPYFWAPFILLGNWL